MARELSEKDWALLRRMAPECGGEICNGSGHAFRSILPPLANHFSSGDQDFADRLGRLDDDEVRYLVDLVRDGRESLGCLPPEHACRFLDFVAARLGHAVAEEIFLRMMEPSECPAGE